MKLSSIRELFWPILEKGEKKHHNLITEHSIKKMSADELKISYDLAHQFYNNEQDRKKNVENKSIIFIGAIGFIITLIFNFPKELFSNQNSHPSIVKILLIINLIVIILYFSRTVWYSIKALKRQAYHTIGSSDFITYEKEYVKELIVKIVNHTIRNFNTINKKVDYMTMAQEYFQRAIIALVVYFTLYVLFYWNNIYLICKDILYSLFD